MGMAVSTANAATETGLQPVELGNYARPTDEAVKAWDASIRRAERVIRNWTPTAGGMGLWVCEVSRFDALVADINKLATALQAAVAHASRHGLYPALKSAIDELVSEIESETTALDRFLHQQAHASLH